MALPENLRLAPELLEVIHSYPGLRVRHAQPQRNTNRVAHRDAAAS